MQRLLQPWLNFIRKIPIWIIRGYQWVIGPWLPPACRFFPTCSHYAVDAYQRFGVLHGTRLTFRRLCKCHPFHPGGIDLVP